MGLFDNDDSGFPVTDPDKGFAVGNKPPFLGETGGSDTDDLTCEVCGKALTYSGRGRKPKRCDEHKTSRASSQTSTVRGKVKPADVENACEALNAAYTAFVFPLSMLSPVAATVWTEQLEALDRRNHMMLATNKPLVDRINSGAEKGGTLAFALSQLVALFPVLLTLRMEMAGRARPVAVEDEPMPEPTPIDPDAAFRR